MQPDFERNAAAMVAGTQKAINAAVAPLVARADAAEARVLELETRLAAVETREPVPGPQGPAGPAGERGPGGFGLAGGMIDRSGVLILTLSNGEVKELGQVVGKDGQNGSDGKSVDLDEVMEVAAPLITSAVADAVEALPKPKDGEPGRDGKDGTSVGITDVAPLIEGAVAKAVAALPPAEPGRDGKDVDMEAVGEIVQTVSEKAAKEYVDTIMAELPVPQDGKDGTSVTIDDVAPLIASEVEKAVSALPPAEKGEPGRDADMEQVSAHIVTAVKSAVEALPAPKDGAPGKDGIGVSKALIDASGALVLTLTDGSVQELGKVKGDDGKPGETFTLDDFDIVQYDDGRTFKFCFTRGEFMHSFEFAFPVPLDKGVHREGQAYERGDMVSFGGSLFIAQRDTIDKPETSDAWRLAVKRGRDGKPGKDAGNG